MKKEKRAFVSWLTNHNERDREHLSLSRSSHSFVAVRFFCTQWEKWHSAVIGCQLLSSSIFENFIKRSTSYAFRCSFVLTFSLLRSSIVNLTLIWSFFIPIDSSWDPLQLCFLFHCDWMKRSAASSLKLISRHCAPSCGTFIFGDLRPNALPDRVGLKR